MPYDNQEVLLWLDIENKSRSRTAELVNSRELITRYEIETLLKTNFVVSEDLAALNEEDEANAKRISTTFAARLQMPEAKNHLVFVK